MQTTQQPIKPITMPGIHSRFYNFFVQIANDYQQPHILDAGAGYGAFVQRLWQSGYKNLSACDKFPNIFQFDQINCQEADLTKSLPYPEQTFDMVLSIEVMEHIHDHQDFFEAAYRVLNPGGVLLISTPNILSIKSRLRFLLSGFYYSFEPLDHQRNDGLQHLSSLTIDQYNDIAIRSGFGNTKIAIDKRQRSSMMYSFLIPFMWLFCKIKRLNYNVHNQYAYLTGRILFIAFYKKG